MFEATLLISVVATAMIYLLATYGLVVTYRVAGVFNFAFGFQAAFAAFLYWQFNVDWGWNKFFSVAVIVFVITPLFGLVVQQILFRKRREILMAIIVTIGLGTALAGLIGVIWGGTSEVRKVPSIFGAKFWHVGDAVITANQIGVVALAIVIGIVLYLLMNRSRLGLQMRAAVDDPELAGATGTPYGKVNGAAWIVGCMLASISGILVAPELSLELTLLNALVVNAFAVVAFSGMTSLPLAVVGAVLLAYAQALVVRYSDSFSWVGTGASDVIPFIMLGLALLLHPAARRTVRVIGAGLQQKLREQASGNVSVGVVAAVVLTAVATLLLNDAWAFAALQAACFALAALSLVLLVGASGQISLCQVSFMGIGAIVLGKMTGVPWGIGVIVAILAAAGAGLIVSLCAFRLRGLFLALLTFAFAYAANILLFQNSNVISFAGLSVSRPHFFGLDLSNDKTFLVFVAAIVIICIVFVGALLKGPWGRALQTLSAGDSVASVSGLPVRSWKMAVFTTSAGLAGLAGALFAAVNITVTGDSYLPEQSIYLLVYAVVGGITTPSGALLAGIIAGASGKILELFIPNPGSWALVLFGVMAMQMAIQYPGGYGGMLPQSIPGIGKLREKVWPSRDAATSDPPPGAATGGAT